MNLTDLVRYLDDYLAIADVPDYRDAFNGLQVEGRTEIRKVAVAVDACQATIDKAVESGADLMIVHHGLLWGTKAPITGSVYKRLSALMRNDVALYSCHLPLDVHAEVGNNHVLARMLGLCVGGRFCEFEGVPLGVWADSEITREDLVRRVSESLEIEPRVIGMGPTMLQRVGIVTGGAGSHIADAARAGCDGFITGEGAHHTYFDAEELGVNVIYAGHYATETVGVKALAQHLEERFALETFFIHHPTGL